MDQLRGVSPNSNQIVKTKLCWLTINQDYVTTLTISCLKCFQEHIIAQCLAALEKLGEIAAILFLCYEKQRLKKL